MWPPYCVTVCLVLFRYGVLFLFVFYLQRNSSPSCRALLWTPGTPMFPPGLRRCSLLVCHSSISQHKAGTNTRALHSTSFSNTASFPGHKNKTYAVRALKKIKVYPDKLQTVPLRLVCEPVPKQLPIHTETSAQTQIYNLSCQDSSLLSAQYACAYLASTTANRLKLNKHVSLFLFLDQC